MISKEYLLKYTTSFQRGRRYIIRIQKQNKSTNRYQTTIVDTAFPLQVIVQHQTILSGVISQRAERVWTTQLVEAGVACVAVPEALSRLELPRADKGGLRGVMGV